MSTQLAILDRADTAAAVLSPVRRRILRALGEPGSATTVGQAIGLPRQKVNYHLRTLEEAGLVEHVEDRRKGNCTERIVKATATHYLISPSVLGALGDTPTQRADALSSDHLAAVSARTISEVAELRRRAAEAGKRLPTFSLETAVRFATPGDHAAFMEDLSNHVAALIARYHDESESEGRWFRLALGSHPALKAVPREEEEDDDE
ncbi:MAG: helix-turn-helix transcriptional regulator [Gemmatimonadetes bacterium]|nr:helix-turn-helix domain-containing protein [Gemmatimonadota bacterium]NNL30812.1 helix-turn-helix transcriptional regulator [Gemmatimonadota bacterium]